jgi:hypothetical protein
MDMQQQDENEDENNNSDWNTAAAALYLSSPYYQIEEEDDEFDNKDTTRLTPAAQKKKPKGEKKRSAPGRCRDLGSLKFARTDAINGEVGSRAINVSTEEEEGEKNVLVAFSSSVDRSVGSAGDAVTVYCPRGKYSAQKWDDSRKISQGAAIVKGKEMTPQVKDGCKKMIARAAVIGMLNASYRSISSPLKHIGNIEKVNLICLLFVLLCFFYSN